MKTYLKMKVIHRAIHVSFKLFAYFPFFFLLLIITAFTIVVLPIASCTNDKDTEEETNLINKTSYSYLNLIFYQAKKTSTKAELVSSAIDDEQSAASGLKLKLSTTLEGSTEPESQPPQAQASPGQSTATQPRISSAAINPKSLMTRQQVLAGADGGTGAFTTDKNGNITVRTRAVGDTPEFILGGAEDINASRTDVSYRRMMVDGKEYYQPYERVTTSLVKTHNVADDGPMEHHKSGQRPFVDQIKTVTEKAGSNGKFGDSTRTKYETVRMNPNGTYTAIPANRAGGRDGYIGDGGVENLAKQIMTGSASQTRHLSGISTIPALRTEQMEEIDKTYLTENFDQCFTTRAYFISDNTIIYNDTKNNCKGDVISITAHREYQKVGFYLPHSQNVPIGEIGTITLGQDTWRIIQMVFPASAQKRLKLIDIDANDELFNDSTAYDKITTETKEN